MSPNRRLLAIPAILVAVALSLTGCGSDSGNITAEGAPKKAESSGSGANDGAGDSSGGAEDGSTDESGTETTDLSVPDLGDLPAGSEACVALGLTIGATAAGAMGMGNEDELAQMKEQLEQYKSEVPEELRDDLDVMEQAFAKMSDGGIMAAGEAMSTPEFEEAQANIEAYMNENCGGI